MSLTWTESVLLKPADELTEGDIIHDWNEVHRSAPRICPAFTILDETLRDGVQSPTAHDPGIADKVRFVHLVEALGVEHVNIGLPGAGPRAAEHVAILAREIRDAHLKVKPVCAARTHHDDITPIIEVAQKVGIEIEVMAFIGSSAIRIYAEDWDLPHLLRLSSDAIDLAVRARLPITYVTEDTTRARPEVLTALFRTVIDHGAARLCLCDTVGHATPDGVRNLIGFTRDLLATVGRPVGIDWHGHNDRGLALINAIQALECGADRVHATTLGVGERVGNAALDQLLLNLKLLGVLPGRDLSRLGDLCRHVAAACRVPIAHNYPIFGADAFRTGTGVHAAAIIKADRKGHAFLADRIYSGVPASMVGREQEIGIGHMSGESNVVYWLGRRGMEADPDLVRHILDFAKNNDHLLSDDEIHAVVRAHASARSSSSPGRK